MPMVNPDEAEEKFEKLATSMKGTSGDEEEKEGACESVQQAVQVLDGFSKKTVERSISETPKEEDLMVSNSYDPLSNKEILGISEKILKKNFDLGEEGYDIARDGGKVKPSKDKKDATTMPPSEEMKKTQKKSKGKSALELVKAKYKDSIMDTEKKKEEK